MELHEWLSADGNFSWLTEDAIEILGSCFTLQLQRLQPGEVCESRERLGYLLQGSGKAETDRGTKTAAAGALLGTALGGPRGHRQSRTVFTAEEVCTVWWLSYDVMEFACHRSCWFHTKLMMTIQDMLEKEKEKR